ncbi:tumor necrosis factor receptor superfamily member 12A [Hyperolius riggenbachi]|uniref:tumor necrosis factor receptor superfamily member 12A n=1 Tax=Hyperolius riggenbachi TaxID=752182 RepID=UPI0035A342E8
MRSYVVLTSLLLLLLVEVSRQEVTDPPCDSGYQWSDDLSKCKACSICEISSKDDFCQKCDSSDKQDFFWIWVAVGSGSAVFIITIILALTIYMTRFRRKNKFTTPIEETGAHSAEELLIH